MVIIMKVRLGYACICTSLSGITTSSTYTYTSFNKDNDFEKLNKVIISNLEALIQILKFNQKNNIHFYRLSSNIIPLATHNKVIFDYLDKYKEYYDKIAKIINNNDMRIDMHPSTYSILNSVKKEVVENTINILKYHYDLMSYMNIENKIIIIHIGSSTFGKSNSLTRFINNFKKLPEYLKKSIAIENDDKIFTIDDCLYLSEKLDIPVVLDYHHFLCNNTGKNIINYLEQIFKSWKNINPKIHFSTPQNSNNYRTHNPYINADDFIEFLSILKNYNYNIDIMLEAKNKDEALFKLIRELKYKTNYEFIDDTSFIIKNKKA